MNIPSRFNIYQAKKTFWLIYCPELQYNKILRTFVQIQISYQQKKYCLSSKQMKYKCHRKWVIIWTSQTKTKTNPVNNIQPPPKDPLLEISIATIKYEQRRGEDSKKIIRNLENNRTSKHKNFILCSKTGLLLFALNANRPRPEEVEYKIMIPKILQAKCLRIHYLTHYGIDKTYHSHYEKYFWKGMHSDATNFVNSCHRCITNKLYFVNIFFMLCVWSPNLILYQCKTFSSHTSLFLFFHFLSIHFLHSHDTNLVPN